jgi:hypothetical protein
MEVPDINNLGKLLSLNQQLQAPQNDGVLAQFWHRSCVIDQDSGIFIPRHVRHRPPISETIPSIRPPLLKKESIGDSRGYYTRLRKAAPVVSEIQYYPSRQQYWRSVRTGRARQTKLKNFLKPIIL